MQVLSSHAVRRFVSIFELILIGVCIGAVVGSICALFGEVLLAITALRSVHPLWFIPFLAVGGTVVVGVYQQYAGAASRGMGLIFNVGQGKEDSIPLRLIPLIMGGTWLSHLVGASAGREGVAVQIGAALAHYTKRWLGKLPGLGVDAQTLGKILVVTGMAAGFGGLFRTPLAACAFALEVLVVGKLEYRALPSALAAALCAAITSGAWGLEKFEVAVPALAIVQTWDILTIAQLAAVGFIFGLVGGAFAWCLSATKKRVAKVLTPLKRVVLIGLVLSVALLVLGQGRYAGLGTNLIGLSFTSAQGITGFDFALKFAFTVLTLAAGYQGGEVTPLFAIGATLGVVLGPLFGLPTMLCAALGYAAVFGAATNTLLAPVLIGGEVFGFANLPAFALVCTVAYLVNLNQSIYSQQQS